MNRILAWNRNVAWLSFAAIALMSTNVLAGDEPRTLTDADYSPERIADLIKQLDEEELDTKVEAIRALGDLGIEARPAAAKLIVLLADETPSTPFFAPIRRAVCDLAGESLSYIGLEVISRLQDKIRGQSTNVQQLVARIARRLGTRGREFLPQLLEEYRTAKEVDRPLLLMTIAAVDPTGEASFPELLKALRQNENQWMRGTAASALNRSDSAFSGYLIKSSPANRWIRRSPQNTTVYSDALLAALNDKSPDVRATAAQSLATYPEVAKQAVPALLQLLSDKEFYAVAYAPDFSGREVVASAAASSLTQFHDQADQILPALIRTIPDISGLNAESITELVLHSQKPLSYLTTLLEGPRPDLALTALARMGQGAISTTTMLEKLTLHKQKVIAAQANLALACIDSQGHPQAVNVAKKMIQSDRQEACRFLRAVGPRAAFAVPFLQTAFADNKDAFFLEWWGILQTLESIGSEASAAAPMIIDSLGTNQGTGTPIKEKALVSFGPSIVPQLVAALKDPARSPSHRIACLHVLGRLGSKAADSVPLIVAQLDSQYPDVRKAAAQALGSIVSRPNESLPALQKMLVDPRPFVRVAAAQGVSAFAQVAEPTVPELIRLLSDEYLDVRLAAVIALGKLGPLAKNAVPRLNVMKDDSNVLIGDMVRETLAEIVKSM
ncbi:MAG: repeat-containing protein [Planctomycetaceae bacterium]|nr:repeat-containing protein [Planctomycetaceae bacterium]